MTEMPEEDEEFESRVGSSRARSTDEVDDTAGSVDPRSGRSLGRNDEGATNLSAINLTAGVRFGSQDSIDCDTVYKVDRLPDVRTCKALCLHPLESRNLIVVQEGVVAECFKGLPDETNNALFHTYKLHTQIAPYVVTQAVMRNVPLKVVRATRVILSQLSRTAYRTDVKEALASLNMARRAEVLSRIAFTHLELSPDALKTIAFQLVQTTALIDGHELFTKRDLVEYHPAAADLIARRPSSLRPLDELRDSLLDQVDGVYVRQKGPLNLFMYGNALAIREWNQYARQSRGVVIDMERERCLAFPMEKFFRFGEGPEMNRASLAADTAVEIVEKVDGSMVSLLDHDGSLRFCCKGNFDTPQSQRAERIARGTAVRALRTDRYFHVFEVIYPENRFPLGLGIVDYGDREDLVLTSMRDRLTNRCLSYAEVIAEAQRVGVSHPRVFGGSLADVFNQVDAAGRQLHEEGFIIRRTDGKLFKLKYEGYKEVLRMVNEMRTERFVREHLALAPEDREKSLQVLPHDIRIVAERQLDRIRELVDRVVAYCADVEAVAPREARELAEFVLSRVPAFVQKLVFQFIKKGLGDAGPAAEKAALEIHEGRESLPILPGERDTENSEKA
jgi:hypothetical protein